MNNIFEEHGGFYTLGADGMLYPNLVLEPKEHSGLYERLILDGTLDKHLADAEERARLMLEKLISQMAQQEGFTERLKASDQMNWVQRMNSIRSRAEEIIRQEIINTL